MTKAQPNAFPPFGPPDATRQSDKQTAIVIDHPFRIQRRHPQRPPAPAQVSERQATADYIAQLSGELARMAEAQGLTVLTYFLDMAVVEAKVAMVAMDGDTRG